MILILKNKFTTYLTIFTVSSIIALYSFEIYLFLFNNSNINILNKKINLYKEETGLDFDTRDVLKAYKEDFLGLNIKTSIANVVNKKYYDVNTIKPLAGVSKAKTINCAENGFYSIYQSDRFGFNNSDKIWDSTEFEYVLLGDSFIHGACVNRPYDISSVLSNLSNKTVLNLGYGGNGPLSQYAIMKEYLTKKTNKIFWFYFEGNDNGDFKTEMNNPILNKYFSDNNFTQNLVDKQKIIDDLLLNMIDNKIDTYSNVNEKNIKRSIFPSSLRRFIKLSNTRGIILNESDKINLDNFSLLMKKVKNLAEINNSELYFVYLPEHTRYKNIYYNNNNYNMVRDIINNLEINFVDINKEIFDKEEDPLEFFPFGLYGHYNSKGYYKIAEYIYSIN